MTEAGHIALIIALPVAVFTIIAAITGARAELRRLLIAARSGVLIIFGLYTLALALVSYAFFTRDYSLTIVAEHASNNLPSVYTLSTIVISIKLKCLCNRRRILSVCIGGSGCLARWRRIAP